MSFTHFIKLALEEDIKGSDITTQTIIPKKCTLRASIIAQDNGILCGNDVARQVFSLYDHSLTYNELIKDSSVLKPGYIVASIEGNAQSILSCERLALNFLQRLSGIATNTAKFVERVKCTGVKLLDTRKNIPGYRELEKYAVRSGGGENHRFGLHDQILIKDNHIALVGLRAAAEAVKKKYPDAAIEVECQNEEQLREALHCGVHTIMLDNMNIEDLQRLIPVCKGKVKVEVSGNVTLETIEAIARLKPDRISVGRALTLNAHSLDFSLDVEKRN